MDNSVLRASREWPLNEGLSCGGEAGAWADPPWGAGLLSILRARSRQQAGARPRSLRNGLCLLMWRMMEL